MRLAKQQGVWWHIVLTNLFSFFGLSVLCEGPGRGNFGGNHLVERHLPPTLHHQNNIQPILPITNTRIDWEIQGPFPSCKKERNWNIVILHELVKGTLFNLWQRRIDFRYIVSLELFSLGEIIFLVGHRRKWCCWKECAKSSQVVGIYHLYCPLKSLDCL